jgi:hypothetical protein
MARGSEKRLLAEMERLISSGQKGPYYIFTAYPRLKTNEDVRRLLAELATKEDLRVPGAW